MWHLVVGWKRPLLICCIGLAIPSKALFFRLPSKEQWCFTVECSYDKRKIIGSWEAAGKREGLWVTIHDSSNRETFHSKEITGRFRQFAHLLGKQTLCFQSLVKNVQTVSFNIQVEEHGADVSDHIMDHHVDDMNDLIMKLQERSEEMNEQQEYSITREAVHRELSNSTNSQVCWWTGVEAVVLVLMAILQVTCMRSRFERKSVV
eukprot:gnl/MRDRNA2_/MRDRNA2_100289_c0_seq1.p1 gnl/MRDRNA2_/MRDRNA2_100289_c0~~gnl/MRDRNA2_/MRDRNA2_100289_c0_seq1.p1  ORF type:complete len:205 (-),score=28.74 gnl/MRDRNA2_/MRDRNA2_100289_c0_seq1:17-631(-)